MAFPWLIGESIVIRGGAIQDCLEYDGISVASLRWRQFCKTQLIRHRCTLVVNEWAQRS